ncbi:MAG: formylmethanofuran--tetrahydromethanopterin N-formyltransferase [Candidatus Bathyarchaeia archaeon]
MKLGVAELIDDFTEMFPMWVSRLLITADTPEWALTAAHVATGFATSIIMSPAEAGIEGIQPENTPDGRPGVYVQIYHTDRVMLRTQLLFRIGQCILTCPTTALFDGLKDAKRRFKIGKSLSMFGDGFQKEDAIDGRKVWRIPVMEGEFIIEESLGVTRGVAGGMFLILASDKASGLKAAETAVEVIRTVEGVILPFPGGICRSGSKVGSLKYKLRASTNHLFCPTIKSQVKDSRIPEGVNSVYEIVINGLTFDSVKKALKIGIEAASQFDGVKYITTANYGGKLGPYKLYLSEALK